MPACTNCQHMNPPDAVFCMNCGTKLTRACTNCGTALPAEARFCMNCGQPVGSSTASDEKRRASLAAVTPAPLAEKNRASHVDGERKLVTVLFADVVGSTALADQMDPEEWTAIMNRAFERISPAIHRYEGTIARLMGDALLAFFGAPLAHEDDAVRAIRASLDLLESVRDYAATVRREYGIDFAMRVGLNTGMVIVGAVGSDLKFEYTAMGDAVNLAARMQTAAEPGTVLISEATRKQAAPFFEYEDLGRISVKGKAEPVHVFRVLGERAGVNAGAARGIEGLSSPLVGRNAELRMLQEALAALRAGRGQIVAILGEAGLGKSRLVAEVRMRSMQSAAIRWMEGRALSYQSAVPYAPVIDMLSAFLGLHQLHGNAEKYQALKTAIGDVAPGRADDIAPYVASVLGITPSKGDIDRVRYLEPPLLRGKVFQAIGEWTAALAARQPLVMVFEDLHWADPTTLDLIDQLMPLTDHSPFMIMALLRPRHNEPAWRFHENASRDYGHNYTAISLNPLDDAQSRELVANLLEIEDLPDKVRELILARAEGNPFFVEEVIRSLLDAGLVVRQMGHWRATREIEHIAVPDSLVGVISARLDRLDEAAKRTAQTAAVIGRQFGYDVLVEIAEPAQAFDTALETLQSRELIREKYADLQRAYVFKHVLVQETAYASVLLSRRRELHHRVAVCLERLAPEQAGVIAWHFVEAREHARATPYQLRAGDRAARAYSVAEAMGYYTQALESLKIVDDTAMARRAYEGKAGAQMLSNDMPAAEQSYREMLQYAETHGDIPMQVSALNKLARTVMFMGQMEQSYALLQQAEHLARAEEDHAGLAEMYTIRCSACNLQGDFEGTARNMNEATKLGRLLNADDQVVFGMAHMAAALTNMTRYDEAIAQMNEAMQVADAAGNLQYKAELLTLTGPELRLREGDLAGARRFAEEGGALARRIGMVVPETVSGLYQGMVDAMQGEYEDALAILERALPVSHLTGMPFMEVYLLGVLGNVGLAIGPAMAEMVDRSHDRALRMMDHPMGAVAGGYTWGDIGMCMLAKGKLDAAEGILLKGLDTPTLHGRVNRPRFLLGLTYLGLARHDTAEATRRITAARQYVDERRMKHFYPEVALAEGQVSLASDGAAVYEKALERFEQAESTAAEMTMRPLVWQARAASARVLDRMGRPADAEAKRRSARAMVDQIAGLFHDGKLRAQYAEYAGGQIAAQAGVQSII